MVDCYSAHKDAAVAYATARSQLDALHGATCDSVVPLVRQIAMGKLVAESDLDGLVTLLTKMISAESTASEIGQLDHIADIAENQVKHIAKHVWQREEDLKEKKGRSVNFADLKRLIQRQITL